MILQAISTQNAGKKIELRRRDEGTAIAAIPKEKLDSLDVVQTPKGARVKGLAKMNEDARFLFAANGTYFDRKGGELVPTGGLISKDGPSWMFSFEVAAGLDMKRNGVKTVKKAAKEAEWTSAFITLDSPLFLGKESLIIRTKDLEKYFKREFGAPLFNYRAYYFDLVKKLIGEGAGKEQIDAAEAKLWKTWLGDGWVRITWPSFEAGRMIVESGKPTKETIEDNKSHSTRRTAVAITDMGETLVLSTDMRLDQEGLANYVIESGKTMGKRVVSCLQSDGGSSQQAMVEGKAIPVKARPVANYFVVAERKEE